MNKGELVDSVYESLDRSVTKQDVAAVISGVFAAIAETVASNEKVTLVGFGTFEKRERKAREGHNPKTGEKLEIPATSVPVFSAGKNFKELVGGE